MNKIGKIVCPVLLAVILSSSISAAENVSSVEGGGREIRQERSIMNFINQDSLIKIGVGILAIMLLAISALVYYRDRRIKFLMLTLAFLMFTLKGILGLVDLFYPRDSPLLIPFSDSFDFVILLLFFIAVLKE